MNAVTITGLTRVTNAKPNPRGSTVLAYFDCVANGIALRGCFFVRTPNQGLTVWPPKIEDSESNRRSVGIADSSLRHALMQNAQNAYRALGGTDGEWISSDGAGRGIDDAQAHS